MKKVLKCIAFALVLAAPVVSYASPVSCPENIQRDAESVYDRFNVASKARNATAVLATLSEDRIAYFKEVNDEFGKDYFNKIMFALQGTAVEGFQTDDCTWSEGDRTVHLVGREVKKGSKAVKSKRTFSVDLVLGNGGWGIKDVSVD